MANPIKALNENFLYNSVLASALMQLLPTKERQSVRLWIEKLYRLSDSINADELTIRNDYIWFILLQLQKAKIVPPFDKPPSIGKLLSLKDILSPQVYKEIILTNDQNTSWLDKVDETDQKNVPKSPATNFITMDPQTFLENQPIPQHGIICYMSAFSDYEN